MFSYWNLPVSVTSADVQRLGDLGRQLDAEVLVQVPDDLGRAGGAVHDEVRGAEARVVVVVVDVHDVRVVAPQEADRHPVEVAAVEEHDRALLGVRRQRRG